MGENTITAEEVSQAQQAWGEGIVVIGKIFTDGGDYVKAAENHIDTLYDFQSGPVLFKPTKAAESQFRMTRESAVSYFVSGNDNFKEDHGFAIHPWTKVRFENAGTFITGNYAVAMGNYFFTETDGTEVKVEYTFGYVKDAEGQLNINLHHSSVPFSAD
ncbi:MAG: hypothetical protein MI799_07165 [Desulfobacterales bacterium]|nr:hypothetical protein [Desulfobacterales bacterium]